MLTKNRTAFFLFLSFFLVLNPLLAFLKSEHSALNFISDYKDQVRKIVLKNGMTFLLLSRTANFPVTFYIRYRVGAVNEKPNQTGTAHMLEHMMFKGTKRIGTLDYQKEKVILKKIFLTGIQLDGLSKKLIEKGSSYSTEKLAEINQEIKVLKSQLNEFQSQHEKLVIENHLSNLYYSQGGVNISAFTTKDYTDYKIVLPPDKLELWAKIESDRMKNLVLRDFYSEREVVIQERLRNYEVNPVGILKESILKEAFTVHPYGRPSIGYLNDIQYMNPRAVKEFYDNYYAPNNVIVAIVGNFDMDTMIDNIYHYFNPIPKGKSVEKIKLIEPKQTMEKRIQIKKESEPLIFFGYFVPGITQDNGSLFHVLKELLIRPSKSRLYTALVQNQLASSVSIEAFPCIRYPYLFTIIVKPLQSKLLDEIKTRVYDEILRLKNSPVEDEELDWTKSKINADLVRNFASDQDLADQLIYFEDYHGDWKKLFSYSKKINSVTKEEIQNIIKQCFYKDNHIIAYLEGN